VAFDDLSFLRPVGKLIVWLFIEFVYEIVFQLLCVWIGRIVLLLITFGKYPNSDQVHQNEAMIGFLGMFVVFLVAFFAYQYVL